MISYTKRYINIISLIITIILYFFIMNSNLIFNQIFKIPQSISKRFQRNIEIKAENNINQDTNENNNDDEKIQIITSKTKENDDWKIKIPRISLEASISEGTSKETMDQFVGHFEETATNNGNVGLAAHNRGYKVNYFSDLKKLKEGDEIIYINKEFEKVYEVSKNKIIKDTDWSYLENTEDNRITLITCVENQPDFRRCVQGIEK